MNLFFNKNIVSGYKSQSQIIRVLSENWLSDNMYCPCCGNNTIEKLPNNAPVADFHCNDCGEIFELKSKMGAVGRKIVDGAYTTAINRIVSDTNPELFVLQYDKNFVVSDLTLIPKFFFTPVIIEKRKPLAETARRAGWVGSNILYCDIPKQGKIEVICNGVVLDKEQVIETYDNSKRLFIADMENRGWLFDVLAIVNNIENDRFSLHEVYRHVTMLEKLHPNNHNIEAKIRQQLQILRDKGVLTFLGNGEYIKK